MRLKSTNLIISFSGNVIRYYLVVDVEHTREKNKWNQQFSSDEYNKDYMQWT